MGKFRSALETVKAVKQELQNSVTTNESNAVITEIQMEDDKLVSLTIKVSENLRQHWQIEAKRRRTSVTQIIIQHLKSELGEP
jgi:predicted HicB family RNase H-like nuclease